VKNGKILSESWFVVDKSLKQHLLMQASSCLAFFLVEGEANRQNNG
jgi:hypothetical protein